MVLVVFNFKTTPKGKKNKVFDSIHLFFFLFSRSSLMYDFLFFPFLHDSFPSIPPFVTFFIYLWYFLLDDVHLLSNFGRTRNRRVSNVSSLHFMHSARSLSYTVNFIKWLKNN